MSIDDVSGRFSCQRFDRQPFSRRPVPKAAVPLVVLHERERWPYFDDRSDRRPIPDAWIAAQPVRGLGPLPFALLKSCRS